MRFTYTIFYVPGKQLTIADALSRAPVTPSTDDDKFCAEIDTYVNLTIQNIPTTQSRLKAIKAAQAEDEVCQKLFHYCKYGWPHQHKIPGPVCPYLSVASKLIVHDGLLLKGSRIVMP